MSLLKDAVMGCSRPLEALMTQVVLTAAKKEWGESYKEKLLNDIRKRNAQEKTKGPRGHGIIIPEIGKWSLGQLKSISFMWKNKRSGHLFPESILRDNFIKETRDQSGHSDDLYKKNAQAYLIRIPTVFDSLEKAIQKYM